MIADCIVIGLGGAIGAVARYLVGLAVPAPRNGFPAGTFIINIAGAFCIGIINALSAKHTDINPRLVKFLKIGICGGFTTFSTFSLESAGLLQNGRTFTGFFYMAVSVFAGIAAIYAAEAIIR